MKKPRESGGEESRVPVRRRHVPWTVKTKLLFGARGAPTGWLLLAFALRVFSQAYFQHLGDPSHSVASAILTSLFIASPVLALSAWVIVPSFGAGSRAVRLLEYGAIARARLVSEKPTFLRVHQKPIYDLGFEFRPEGDDEVHQIVIRTTEVAALSDELEEQIVYDPAHPEDGVLLDNLPGGPRSGHGDVVRLTKGSTPPLALLAFPTLVVLQLLGLVRTVFG